MRGSTVDGEQKFSETSAPVLEKPLEPAGASLLGTLREMTLSITGTIQLSEADTKNISYWYVGKILSQEPLKAVGKDCVGAACVGIVHIRHSLYPQYAA